MNGWMGKMIAIDLGSGKQEELPVSDDVRRRFLGGRGAGGQAVQRSVPGDRPTRSPPKTPCSS